MMGRVERLMEVDDLPSQYRAAIENRYQYNNCYFQIAELDGWARDGLVRGYAIESGLLISKREKDFEKLYFLSDSMKWMGGMQDIKKALQTDSLVIEIVSRGESNEYDIGKYTPVQEVIRYDRMKSVGKRVELNERATNCFCEKSDFETIRTMMDGTFNPIGDYIPSDEELRGLISSQSVICERDESRVVGFIIFEDKKKTSYIRMVCVDKRYRGRHIGRKMLDNYFALHRDFKGFTLWCRSDNIVAKSLYSDGGGVQR